MKSPVNWKGGLRALVYFSAVYFAFLYFMFFIEPVGGWRGSLHFLKYPAAVIAPVVFLVVVYKIFKGDR